MSILKHKEFIADMKQNIPNLLTATNLLCGTIALVYIANGDLPGASLMVVIALVMDFFDGFVARLLGVSSPIGKELDSLADMVTFGVVPGFIMARLIQESLALDFPPSTVLSTEVAPYYLVGFLIPVFSAFRLAKFNLDTRQSDAFYGVPTPANTILILSFWLIGAYRPDNFLATWLSNTWVLIALAIISSYLLVADVRLLALKFKNFSVQDNLFRYILIGSAILLLIIFQYVGVPFIILLYLILSMVDNIRNPQSA